MFIKQDEIAPVEFDRLKIIDYTAGQDLSSSLAQIIVPVGTSHKISWSKRSDKYYYVVQGTVHFTIGEEHNVLSSGDVCIVPEGERFAYGNDGPDIAKLILVHTPNFKLEFEVFESQKE